MPGRNSSKRPQFRGPSETTAQTSQRSHCSYRPALRPLHVAVSKRSSSQSVPKHQNKPLQTGHVYTVNKWIGKLLPQNELLRGAGFLIGGSIFAQMLTMLAMPVLTRLYTPSEFGVFAMYISVVSVVSVFSGLRYDNAIPMVDSDADAYNLLVLANGINLFVALCFFSLFSIFHGNLERYVDGEDTTLYIIVISLGILASGMYGSFNYLITRTKQFSIIGKSKILQSAVSVIVQLSLSAVGGLGLVIGYVLGQGLGYVRLAKSSNIVENSRRYVTQNNIKKVAKRYRRFPIFSTWEGIFNSASNELMTIVGAIFFAPYYVGIYMLVNKTISMPAGLISGSGSQVYYVHGAEAKRNGNLTHLTRNIAIQLFKMAAIPSAIMSIIGPVLYPVVFGEAFVESASLVPWVMAWVFVQTMSSTLTPLIAINEVQHFGMLWNFILLCMRVSALYIGIRYYQFYETVVLFCLASLVAYIVLWVWMIKLSGNGLSVLVKVYLFESLRYLLLLSPMIYVVKFSTSSPDLFDYALVTVSLVGSIWYYLGGIKDLGFNEIKNK